jgi:hypothetical protein
VGLSALRNTRGLGSKGVERPGKGERAQLDPVSVVPASAGWFVLNARDARWFDKPEQGHSVPLTGYDEYEAETFFPMLGMAIRVVGPGRADRHVPLGDGAGRFPRSRGRGPADRRGSGATSQAVGLRPLPTQDPPRLRRRGRRSARPPLRQLWRAAVSSAT